MADNFKNSPNRLGGPERPSDKSEKKEESGEKDVKEASREFVEGVSEVVEDAESAEVISGRVSEKASEDKSKYSGSRSSSGDSATTAQTAHYPELDVMVIQISTRIKKELTALEKERKKYMKPGRFNPSKLNEVMARIRELGDILAELANTTADNVKDLWKRFVQKKKR